MAPSKKLLVALAALAGVSSAATVHQVKVGESGYAYVPSSITAKVGDYVEFSFYYGTHSIAQSDYSSPCQPLEDTNNTLGLYSGLVTPDSDSGYAPTYTIRINNTDPIWFYCAEAYHCQSGMTGVINPPSSGDSLDDYTSSAETQGSNVRPSTVLGNTTVSNDNFTASSSVAASSSSAATSSTAKTTIVSSTVSSSAAATTVSASASASSSAASSAAGVRASGGIAAGLAVLGALIAAF
ncbi:Cupredoxin [Dipodascopsis tothii]|uniref:Cupredoxin n=1 Tax=Dipodascopsis tothii TaxID=44089 RepID=UPI0034D012F5